MSKWKEKSSGDGWYKVKKLSGTVTSGFVKNNTIKFSSDLNFYELEFMLGMEFYGPLEKMDHGLLYEKAN